MLRYIQLFLLFLLISYMYILLLGYNVFYVDDKRYGENGYVVSSDVEKIQIEIMNGGFVEGVFIVYVDFFSYKSGKCFNFMFNLLIFLIYYFIFFIMVGQRMK